MAARTRVRVESGGGGGVDKAPNRKSPNTSECLHMEMTWPSYLACKIRFDREKKLLSE